MDKDNGVGAVAPPFDPVQALVLAGPDLLDVATRWAMAMWQAGISPVENSNDPLESMLFDTHAALFKATGRDVVADVLERQCAVNRAAIAKEGGK